jgi:hypothetical protein
MNEWPLTGTGHCAVIVRFVGDSRTPKRSASRHDRMFKSHIVEQPLNRSALRIGAT